MLQKFRHSAFIFFSLMFLGKAALDGCTGIKLTAKDGSNVQGRTVEFGVEIESSVLFIPRNYPFIAKTPNGDGLKYTAKYAAVGIMAFGQPLIMDGMNEKGLSVGAFYFPAFAGYTEINAQNQSEALSPVDFTNWIVTQFATVDEVKSALDEVVIAPTVIKEWGNTPPPFHYIVYDKNGKSLVIEPVEGKLQIFDNSLGSFTNSPGFNWHLLNLRNFINLTPFNVKPIEIAGMKLIPFGQGSGMVGLPGDFTPPSRFVRASIFSATATPSENSPEAILQTFHILNQFDIPVGAAKEKEKGIIHSDYTMVTVARDPQTLKYYFKTYDDQNLRMVNLNKLNLNGNSLLIKKTQSVQTIADITKSLKPK